MKVIFLDFDGVLNCERYVKQSEQFGVIIDPEKLKLVKKIVDATGAKIVLSTSWREHWDIDTARCDKIGLQINEIFASADIEIFDKIPEINLRRAFQIDCWLSEHPDVTDFVVIDDEFIGADFMNDRFVKTSNYIDGLEEKDVIKAIEILN